MRHCECRMAQVKRLKFFKKSILHRDIIIFFCVIAGIFALSFLDNLIVRNICKLILILFTLIWFFTVTLKKLQTKFLIDELVENSDAMDKYLNPEQIPTCVIDTAGAIRWNNPAFVGLAKMNCVNKNISSIFTDFDRADKNLAVRISGSEFKKDICNIESDGRHFKIIRLIDESAVEKIDAYRSLLTVACYVSVDNYTELAGNISLMDLARLTTGLENLVYGWAEKIHAMVINLDDGRLFMAFEHKHLIDLQHDRFSILAKARDFTSSTGLSPTLSIAVGDGDNVHESNEFAKKAMELAVGRGGDQAVIKGKSGYQFFGGVQRTIEVSSKVRTRTFTGALKNIMEQCDNIIIMGHSTPDMDCIGSSVGLLACARDIDKSAYIVLDGENASITQLLSELRKTPEIDDVIITPAEALGKMSEHTLVIVVDTHVARMLPAPHLIDITKNVIIIDHHLKGTDAIEHTVLSLHESYASSTAEIITEMIPYFSEDIRLLPIEAEALLTAVIVDTKGFSFKTGVRTFEAASFLKKCGANMDNIRKLFQDDMGNFIARTNIIRDAEILPGGIAVAQCPKDAKNRELLTAQAADALLGIRGIAASFVLFETDFGVTISGRSLGDINVQLIMERLGGGGHATIAGGKLKGRDFEQAKAELIDSIQSM